MRRSSNHCFRIILQRHSSISLPALDQQLLLLHQALGDIQRDLERVGHDVGGREGQPLRQRDVFHAVALVDLDPDEVFRLGGILDVVAYLNETFGQRRRPCSRARGQQKHGGGGGVSLGVRNRNRFGLPLLSGNTPVSPARKSNVRAAALPMNTVARAWPLWKYSHSSAYCARNSSS